jgi:hypothetical protein
VSTVGRDEKAIREYLQRQEQEDRRLDQMQMFDGPPPQAAPKQPALSGSHSKPPALLEVLTGEGSSNGRVNPGEATGN